MATTHPELSEHWHPTKNENLTPFDVIAGTHYKIWWKCPKEMTMFTIKVAQRKHRERDALYVRGKGGLFDKYMLNTSRIGIAVAYKNKNNKPSEIGAVQIR